MKKLLFGLGLVLAVGVANAAQDDASSMRPALWRSSTTNAQCNLVLLASGTIHLHAISIDSATVNVGDASRVTLYNSTTPATTLSNFNITTATLLATNVNQPGAIGVYQQTYDMRFSSGVVIDKKGAAQVTILWDYVTPKDTNVAPWRP